MRISKRGVASTAAVALFFTVAWASGVQLAVNTSPSMPRGLYLMRPAGELSRDALAAICLREGKASRTYLTRDYLPPGRTCESGVGMLLKPLAGVPGDVVEITPIGVAINGVVIPRSRSYDNDSQGLPIEHLPIGWRHTLGTDEYFALATHMERSLDSRYYGPVARSQIRAEVSPIISFESGE
ncbi:conjugative transfer signal peptidase TraF [Pandoraea cepalis]|uniref:Conjugative transfer signal peptidase TraF n=1 Tax=Pandoraea cepalis TaxID=2508294 RepID=A0AAW7MH28_9BURK|nr:conjugative transfer signal peptidase TraF [Pandoraea cepalis]MDN4578883.1 conjugative transfer signal peptidase TraF [Pandoraea cepalis]